MASGRNVGHRDRDLTDQRVHIVFLAHLNPRQERLPKQTERYDRHYRKQRPLNPGGDDQTSQHERTDHNGGDAEENDEESTRCRQLNRS